MVFNPYAKNRPAMPQDTAATAASTSTTTNTHPFTHSQNNPYSRTSGCGTNNMTSRTTNSTTTIHNIASNFNNHASAAPSPNPYLKFKKISSNSSSSSATSSANPYLKNSTTSCRMSSPNTNRGQCNSIDSRSSSTSSQTLHSTAQPNASPNRPPPTTSSSTSTFIHRRPAAVNGAPLSAFDSSARIITSISVSTSSIKPPSIHRQNQTCQKTELPTTTHNVSVSSSAAVTASKTINAATSMASLRPSSWSSVSSSSFNHINKPATTETTNAKFSASADEVNSFSIARTTTSSSVTTTNATSETATPHLDNENPLPKELWYDPNQLKPVQDKYKLKLIKNAKVLSPLSNGWTLYPHQRKAVIRALQMRRIILALDMGLGKTLIGCVWAKAFEQTYGDDNKTEDSDNDSIYSDSDDSDVQIKSKSHDDERHRQFPEKHSFKIIIVCPVTLTVEWKRTAKDKVGLTIEGDNEDDIVRELDGESNGRLKKRLKTKKGASSSSSSSLSTSKTTGSVRIYSWAKVPNMVEMSIQNYVVVCDEAHSMQSMTAARTKDVLTLVCDQRCVGVLLLTGTPMKNGKPLNLFPLLRAVRHPLGRHQKAYEQHFCQGRLKQFARGTVWDASGCSNLEQLRRLVRPNLLHMTKEECLKDLPPMSHVFHDVPASRSSQTEYRQAIAVLAKTHANATSDVQNGVTDEAVLGAMQSLRFVCARSKIDAAVELTRSILDEQPAVVVFTSFSRVAKEVHERLNSSGWPTELLTGETPQKKRQELVDKFQEGLSSVFVCTFGAGGVGVTLTAASTIILLDRPWTPGETRQAEDRIRRIGQTKACTSYWMRSFDLDKQIDEMLASKTRTTDAVLNRCTGSGAGVAGQQSQSYHNNGSGLAAPTAKISIKKLVESFVLSEAAKTGTVPGEV